MLPVIDLATLTTAEAARLDGKRARFRVVIDGPSDLRGDFEVYEVLPRDDPHGVLCLRYQLSEMGDAEGELTVEATLRVVHHPVHVVGATTTTAFTEYRLIDAGRVGL